MKISVVVGHVPYSEEADQMLDVCLNSIKGQYDELILVVNDGVGYGNTFNRGFKHATGDYIFLVSNDTQLIEGTLKELVREDEITTPLVNGNQKQFGCFCCIPRHIYEKVGLFDNRFNGAYWEDEDLLKRWENEGINLSLIETVKINHIGGVTVKAIMDEHGLYESNKQVFNDKWNI